MKYQESASFLICGDALKGPCLTRWIWLLMTCVVVLGLNRGRGQFLDFFMCSNYFITQKVYFLQLILICFCLMLAAYFSRSC
jgi:hypothetical protein